MKKLPFILFFIFIAGCCFGADKRLESKIYSGTDFDALLFLNGKVTVIKDLPEISNLTIPDGEYEYSVKEDSGLTFLYIYAASKTYKFLMIQNYDLLFLYDGDNKDPCFYGSTKGMNSLETRFWREYWFSATSSLKEKDYVYEANNLARIKTKEPWVEGVSGYGIGEKIYMETYGKVLYILNGFLSYEKPYLWKQNSRVKKLRIKFLSNPEMQPVIIELNEKDVLQKFVIMPDFNSHLGVHKIEMEILDVYKGSKYDDTCVNGIIVSGIDYN